MFSLRRRKKTPDDAARALSPRQQRKRDKRAHKRRQRRVHNGVFVLNAVILAGAVSGTLMAFDFTVGRSAPGPQVENYSILPMDPPVRGAAPATVPNSEIRREIATKIEASAPTPTVGAGSPLIRVAMRSRQKIQKSAKLKQSAPTADKRPDTQTTRGVPPLPRRHPLRRLPPAVAGKPAPPQTIPHSNPTGQTKPTPPDRWTEQDIARAQQACRTVLRGKNIVYEPVAPIKRGPCGDPAPIRVTKLGGASGVTLTPAVTLNCKMAARLTRWIETSVQPTARKLLGDRIGKIRTMSSYSCRNRYNRKKARLSEHALANAIDIGSFTTADGTHVSVLDDWGPNERKRKAAQLAAQAQRKATKRQAAPGRSEADDKTIAPKPAKRWLAKVATSNPKALPLPKPRDEASKPQTLNAKSRFLRHIHKTACGPFGTVLGPEANQAHENHFHLDMAPRRRSAYCE